MRGGAFREEGVLPTCNRGDFFLRGGAFRAEGYFCMGGRNRQNYLSFLRVGAFRAEGVLSTCNSVWEVETAKITSFF